MRTVLYTGKGGVGKTTTAAAPAVVAAQRGRRTLVASADAAHSLGDVLGERLGPRPQAVAARLDAVEVDARQETERHWGAIRDWLTALFRSQGIEDVVADELAMLPGIEELTTLLAVEHYAREGGHELVVVDCAPTDAALRLLTLPEVAHAALRLLLRLQRAISAVVTPLARGVTGLPLPDAAVFRDAERLIFRRLHRLRERVTAPETTVRLVVTAERMVIDEAERAHTDLALFDVARDAVVLNRVLPEEAAREPWFREWARLGEERRREVAEAFAPLPVLEGPLAEDEVIGREALARHAERLFAGLEPDAVLCATPGLRFDAEADGGVTLQLPLPHVQASALDVAKHDDRLLVATPTRRRAVPLPRAAVRMDLARARLEDGVLHVRLAPPPASPASGPDEAASR
ncbi:MAG: TRC40/GET3/ArsA family transport-energizing ATPase [Myxococcota bacterium]|nr:TRC40/GET3/ArsA family transport-energizing ATPase [Myxococcota bacterium]